MLRKERRRATRFLSDLDADLEEIHLHTGRTLVGDAYRAPVTNISPTGVRVNLPSEQHMGTRYRVHVELLGQKASFYGVISNVTIIVTGPEPIYAHGLQITAIADDIAELIYQYLEVQEPVTRRNASHGSHRRATAHTTTAADTASAGDA